MSFYLSSMLSYDDYGSVEDFVGIQYCVRSHSMTLISLNLMLIGNGDTHLQQERISKPFKE